MLNREDAAIILSIHIGGVPYYVNTLQTNLIQNSQIYLFILMTLFIH